MTSKPETHVKKRRGPEVEAALIREATLQDIPALFRVRLAVNENKMDEQGLADLGITPQSVAMLLQTTCKAWVAECQGNIVGFSIANTETESIWAIFVLPAYEGRGYGRRLLESAMNWLWSCHVEKIWLSTGADPSTRANGFYPYLGWKQEGYLPNGEIRYVLTRNHS